MAPGAKGSPGTRRGVGLESPVAGRVQPTPELPDFWLSLYKRSYFTRVALQSWGVGVQSPVVGRVQPAPETRDILQLLYKRSHFTVATRVGWNRPWQEG